MRLFPIIGLLLLLAACTQATFSIDDTAFGQERMAHSASIGTMYLTSSTFTGSHDCDDSPTTCCASGYHMCTAPELIAGGREIEDAGSGRDATTYNIPGWVDPVVDTAGGDCTGWTASGFTGVFSSCTITATIACGGGSACSVSNQIWCCSS